MKAYQISAYFISEEIPISVAKALFADKQIMLVRRDKLIVKINKEKYLIVFAFGGIVLFNLNKKEKDDVIRIFKKSKIPCLRKILSESYKIKVDNKIKKDSVEFDYVVIKNLSLRRLEIISRILAESVSLEYYESLLKKNFEDVKKINDYIIKYGKLRITSTEVTKLTGKISNILQAALIKIAILDKPSFVWEYKNLEYLYTNLKEMFEIETRFKNLKFKIDYMDNQLTQFLEIIRSKIEQKLEWVIIILIALEVILWLYEMFA